MSRSHRTRSWRRALALTAASLLAVAAAAVAGAEPDSCGEWREEHLRWKTESLRRYLGGVAQREVDEAVFELLQREAWLTSCEDSVEQTQQAMVGWRLVGRLPEEYGSAVVESLLESAGFDLGLHSLLQRLPRMAAASEKPIWRRGRSRVAR